MLLSKREALIDKRRTMAVPTIENENSKVSQGFALRGPVG